MTVRRLHMSLGTFLVLLGLLLVPLNAQANAPGYVETKPCSAGSLSTNWGGGFPDGWYFAYHCPEYLGIRAWPMVSSDRQEFIRSFPAGVPGPGLSIERVTVGLSGSNGAANGLEQGIRVCRVTASDPPECGPIVTVTGPAVINSETTTMTVPTGEIPIGGNQVQLVGHCLEGAVCRDDPGIFATDLSIRYRDDIAPTAHFDLEPYGFHSGHTGWNKADARFGFYGEDGESGVQALDVFWGIGVDLQTGDLLSFHACSREAWSFDGTRDWCPSRFGDSLKLNKWQEEQGPGTPSFFVQGENKLQVTAIDGVGNYSQPTRVSFMYDSVAPWAPSRLHVVEETPTGWIGAGQVTAVWDNLVENLETPTQSGVASASFQLFKAGVNPPPFVPPAILGTAISKISGVPVQKGEWILRVRTTDAAGNIGQWSAIKLKVDPTVLDAPAVVSPVGEVPGEPALVNGERIRDLQAIEWERPANAQQATSSICGYATSAASDPASDPGTDIDIAGDVTSGPFPDGVPQGASWIHIRAVTCAGVGGATAHLPVTADTTPPILGASAPSTGWIAAADAMSVTAADSGSGLKRLWFSIDGGPQQESNTSPAFVPLGPGQHVVTYGAEDVAGNRATADPTAVKVDLSPPDSWFEARDPAAPALVQARVSDAESGVVSARLEFSRVVPGLAADWQPLGRPFVAPGSPQAGVVVAARFPDDDSVPGVYRLRVVAEDAAGHVSAGSTGADGLDETLTTPLRAVPELTAGFESPGKRPCGASKSRKCQRRQKGRTPTALAVQRIVNFGRSGVLRGSLANARGEPLTGVTVDVRSTLLSGGLPATTPVATDAAGRFKLDVRPGPSRKFTVVYAGSDSFRPASASAKLICRAKATFSAGSHRVRAGKPVVLTGRVLTAGADLPRLGKSYEIEYRARGSWQPLTNVRRTFSDGRFRRTIALPAGRTLRYRLRVRVPTEAGWPFAEGFSRTLNLTVVP